MTGFNISRLRTALAVAGMAILMAACGMKDETPADTPTSGNIKISVDESFQPIIDTQLSTFHSLYKYATIKAAYKPEGEVIKELLNDSIRIAILSRDLTPDEKAVFEKKKLIPRVTKIAIDAVALVVNNQNPDTLLTVDQLKAIFSGKVNSWSALNPKNNLKDITVVFDNNNSSTARFIRDSVLVNQPVKPGTYATNSHTELIDYVAKNEKALGVIGVNWVSDFDDTTAVGFLKKVKVVGISTETDPETTESYYQPYQAYIAQGTYPLRRYLYIINTEGRAGLGTGFASFVAGDKGQRIILKSGLVPATMPIRVVGFRE
ncbi:PstS family phosphate ABC transporter substrate-binding protein [Pontibacter ruber]|uniref:PstS family phosphate ABC transporter substrate-binding protein n=2 Tax=Pontibacter ruber TaxID=1343895 RepID=A0ABW5D1L6_9BACT